MKYIFAFLIFVCNCNAQSTNNLWLFGRDCGPNIKCGGTNINFVGVGTQISKYPRPMNLDRTNGVITSKQGNLLFYSNGVYVANAIDSMMKNGDSLNPGWYVNQWAYYGLLLIQGNLIIPLPDDSNKYYLFHETAEVNSNPTFAYSPQLFYSIINMKYDSGLGRVMSKNNIIISDTLIGGLITACKHGNGRDWWVTVHRGNSDIIYTLLLTPNGIQGPFVQHIGTYVNLITNLNTFQACFSPDGKKYALYMSGGFLEIYDFDRCTGLFSNPVQLNISYHAFLGGLAFSPNSRYLYAPSNEYVFQFDVQATNIAATQTTVAVWDTFYSPSPPFATTFFMAQLAPDGKIYINTGNSTDFLHFINYPDLGGIACDVQQHSILLPTYNDFTIPNHPNYFLGVDTGSVCDSLGLPTPETPKPPLGGLILNYIPSWQQLVVNASGLKGKRVTMSIYDGQGSLKVQEFKSSRVNAGYFTTEVDCSGWAKGLYVVYLQTEKESLSKKFIID